MGVRFVFSPIQVEPRGAFLGHLEADREGLRRRLPDLQLAVVHDSYDVVDEVCHAEVHPGRGLERQLAHHQTRRQPPMPLLRLDPLLLQSVFAIPKNRLGRSNA